MKTYDTFTDYTYLSELDSVKQSYDHQIKAELALFNALVYEGKVVVLTYNQIVDSIAFLHLIKDKDTFDVLLNYFKDRRLLVNQYQPNMNLSKYIQDNYLSTTSFKSSYFSFLEQYDLDIQNIIYDGLNESIRYGDSLFLENVMPSVVSLSDQEQLYKYIDFVSTINSYMYEYHCYFHPIKTGDHQHHQLIDYLNLIYQELEVLDKEYADLLKSLIVLDGSNKRSEYLLSLNQMDITNQQKHVLTELVHLAYNYTLEYSILSENNGMLVEDIKAIINDPIKEINNQRAEVKCKWNIGYRITFITSLLYSKTKKLKWSQLIWLSPFVEIIRIMSSLLMAFIVMAIVDSLSSVQMMWQSYSIAVLFTFGYNLVLDEIQDCFVDRLPAWINSSGIFKQIKYFFQVLHLLIKRRTHNG